MSEEDCVLWTACCVIIHGFSGGSANPIWKRRVWSRWDTGTRCDISRGCSLASFIGCCHESVTRSSSKLVGAVRDGDHH